MKLCIALALTAFAGGGAAIAQDTGVAPGIPPPPTFRFTIPYLDDFPRTEVGAASREVRRACAADMRALCAGKTGPAADGCLVYHRLSFSSGCRKAIVGFERAAAPIGHSDTLARFRPYSRTRPVAGAPPKGWRPVPAAPAQGPATGA